MAQVKELNYKNMVLEYLNAQDDMHRVWSTFAHLEDLGFISHEDWFNFSLECGSWVYHDRKVEDMASGEIIKDFNDVVTGAWGCSEYEAILNEDNHYIKAWREMKEMWASCPMDDLRIGPFVFQYNKEDRILTVSNTFMDGKVIYTEKGFYPRPDFLEWCKDWAFMYLEEV